MSYPPEGVAREIQAHTLASTLLTVMACQRPPRAVGSHAELAAAAENAEAGRERDIRGCEQLLHAHRVIPSLRARRISVYALSTPYFSTAASMTS